MVGYQEAVVNANIARSEATPTGKVRWFNWSRIIFGYDFFISFKLGNPPIGSQSYASDLARRLRQSDFTVFYSEEEPLLGEQLDSALVKALHRSRILVVVATEGALLESKWVRKEVEVFRLKHQKDPKRLVIPINVDHAIEKFGQQVETTQWLDYEGRIWQDESQQAINEGITSPEVLKRLELSPLFIRANKRFRWMVATVIMTLIGLALWTGYEVWDANRKLRDTTAMRLVDEGGSMTSGQRPGGTIKGLFKVLAGHRLSRSANTDEALQSEYLKFTQLIFVRENPAAITSAAFSPDGSRVVLGSRDNAMWLWDVKTGKPINQALSGHNGAVSSVAFSPDGKRIVSGSGNFVFRGDNTLRLWDANTGQPIGQPLTGHNGGVSSVAFSPDGARIVSGSTDKTLQFWDAITVKPIGQPLTGHEKAVSSAAFSPDGVSIVSGSVDKTLRLWDAKTGKPIGQPLTGHKGPVFSVAFSPDSKCIVSGSDDGFLRLWDAKTGQAIGQPLRGHTDSVFSVAFSPDGNRIVSGGGNFYSIIKGDWTLRLWNAQTGAVIGDPLKGHDKAVVSVAFSPDGTRILSGSLDHTLRLWDATAGHPIGRPLTGHENEFFSIVAYSPDGTRIISGSGEHTLRFWDSRTGNPLISHSQTRFQRWTLVRVSSPSARTMPGSFPRVPITRCCGIGKPANLSASRLKIMLARLRLSPLAQTAPASHMVVWITA